MAAEPVATSRVSVTAGGEQAGAPSSGPAVSADGRYVAFASEAALVPGDGNVSGDVYLRDRRTGRVSRVSAGVGGADAEGTAGSPSISADGRWVAYVSSARNMLAGEYNRYANVFLQNLRTGHRIRVSRTPGGGQPDFHSHTPVVSADGRYVAYGSMAGDVVDGDTNLAADVFLFDRVTRRTTRISTAADGTEADHSSWSPSISANGRHVVFASLASNLVPSDHPDNSSDIYLYDRATGRIGMVPQATVDAFSPAISADGRFVAYGLLTGFDAGHLHLFDRLTGQTTAVTEAVNGQLAGMSEPVALSADGRYVAFGSRAEFIADDDTNGASDVFVYDRRTGLSTRVSVACDGAEGDGDSRWPAIDAAGRTVAYQSAASSLVAGDTNGVDDVFVTRRGPQWPRRR